VLAAVLCLAASAFGHEASPDGHTTVEQTVVPGPPLDPQKPDFVTLVAGAGRPYVVRSLGAASPQPGRHGRRRSLAYFGQLTDFQLADEESPARVEFFDGGASSAWRPQEGFHPFAIDLSLRQMNNFLRSPVPQGNGHRAALRLAVLTGDQGDNQQVNETIWVRQLVEGQLLNSNSGTTDYSSCPGAARAALEQRDLAHPEQKDPAYTGVQDYDDYPPDATRSYYDPDVPAGRWADWPVYAGLMDRAQRLTFTPAGLRVPSYVVNGNHDGLVQGNEDAIKTYEDIATGCFKTFAPAPGAGGPGDPDPGGLLTAPIGSALMAVPPDIDRRFVSKPQMKAIFAAGSQPDGHGFAFVDPAENAASGGGAAYYAWDPLPGIRFIAIDTLSEGGVVEQSSNGNIDHPQWLWLEGELQRASAQNKLIVLLGHHPVRSLTSDVPDEAAAPCLGEDDHPPPPGTNVKHDTNPGCDLDKRPSTPVHRGSDFVGLLGRYPHVIAYVAGHTHENNVLGFTRPDGTGWWEINTSAVADWPQQNRLIEIMNNRDGTLSIFGTVLDHSAPLGAGPIAPGPASAFGIDQLAALSRAFTYNDPQSDHSADGAPGDRNVELVLPDPR
jgi:hypothetical protein